MSDATLVFLANAVIWLGLGGFMFILARAQAKLRRRLAELNANLERENARV